jgi:hypothetical protein
MDFEDSFPKCLFYLEKDVLVMWTEIRPTSSLDVISFKVEEVWKISSMFRIKEEAKHETSKK